MENVYRPNPTSAKKVIQVQPNPKLALWHIKSVEKQDNRWDADGNYLLPKNDKLM